MAYADFVTAMMALFLVLWLISSTSEKTRHTVAQYFNPVKLVDMSTLKKHLARLARLLGEVVRAGEACW